MLDVRGGLRQDFTPYVKHFTPYVKHFTPYIKHFTPYVKHFTPYVKQNHHQSINQSSLGAGVSWGKEVGLPEKDITLTLKPQP